MDPTYETHVPGNGHSKTRGDRVKEFVTPKLRGARDYFEGHRLITTLLGFGLGFVLGRMLRRS